MIGHHPMQSSGSRSSLKIVEIGDKPFIKSAFPEETYFFSTYAVAPVTDRHAKVFNISLSTIKDLRGLLRDPSVSLIVCHPSPSSPWSPRTISRALFSRRIFNGQVPLLRAFGSQFLRGGHSAPLVVLDHDDFPLINRSNLFLLERCQLYFKRELPIDRWRVFLKTAHANLPTYRFRRLPRWERLVEKLRPISLGLPMMPQPSYPQGSEKTSDIFFAGQVEASSWVRKVGAEELANLSQAGIKVDLPSAGLSRDEFYSRCASSWLVWSPEGYGWDCFRHYEALACGSVPLINYPTIERHNPLIDGEHALFYSGEPGTLRSAVLQALADKERLNRIAVAGRAHVMKHHTASSLAAHIVEQGLAAGRAGQ
jgi:hypothetical protein